MGSIQRPEATLEDRWEKAGETLLLTGIQALVRLPLVRHQLDQAMGWNTARLCQRLSRLAARHL